MDLFRKIADAGHVSTAVFYTTGAVATFGHSAANQTVCSLNDVCSLGRPLGAAIFWPLYWSWVAWS